MASQWLCSVQFPQDLLTAHCPGHYLPAWLLGYEKYVQGGAGRPHLGEGSGPPSPPLLPCTPGRLEQDRPADLDPGAQTLFLALFVEPPQVLAAHYSLLVGGWERPHQGGRGDNYQDLNATYCFGCVFTNGEALFGERQFVGSSRQHNLRTPLSGSE